jgi:5-methylcytosine-specific restriction endonuclease McrA
VTLAENIKQRALFEGFNKVGIVGAESLEDEGRRLKEWLARGHHGEMRWMARDVHKRISPHEIFPQARSVVVVALNYFTPHQHQQNPATGKVCGSRYQVQIDHVIPKAFGGSDDPENLRPLCRQHNLLMAERVFGEHFMRQFRSRSLQKFKSTSSQNSDLKSSR